MLIALVGLSSYGAYRHWGGSIGEGLSDIGSDVRRISGDGNGATPLGAVSATRASEGTLGLNTPPPTSELMVPPAASPPSRDDAGTAPSLASVPSVARDFVGGAWGRLTGGVGGEIPSSAAGTAGDWAATGLGLLWSPAGWGDDVRGIREAAGDFVRDPSWSGAASILGEGLGFFPLGDLVAKPLRMIRDAQKSASGVGLEQGLAASDSLGGGSKKKKAKKKEAEENDRAWRTFQRQLKSLHRARAEAEQIARELGWEPSAPPSRISFLGRSESDRRIERSRVDPESTSASGPGWTEVTVHYTGNRFLAAEGGLMRGISPAELARRVRESPDYRGGPVFVTGCSANRACGTDPTALMEFSRELGMPAVGANRKVALHPDGYLVLTNQSRSKLKGRWDAVDPRPSPNSGPGGSGSASAAPDD